MIKLYCLIIVLLLLLFVILKLNIKRESFINFFGLVRSKDITTDNYIFPMNFTDNDPCTHCIYNDTIVKAHVNNMELDKDTSIHKIHLVNPNNPCCLRTCINDFTPTEENGEIDNSNEKRDKWRSNIVDITGADKNTHYFYTSRCNECVVNFKNAIETLSHEFNKCSI